MTGILRKPTLSEPSWSHSIRQGAHTLSSFFSASHSLEIGTKILNAQLSSSEGELLFTGDFKLLNTVLLSKPPEFSKEYTFQLPRYTQLAKILPVDPNQKVPEILGLGKTDYLQFYRIKYPYSLNSPWHANSTYDQDNLFQIENDLAYQFGWYWLSPYQHADTQPLTCLYEENDVLEKWNILSHPTLLKALNEQRIPYSALGVGSPQYTTLNSNSGCSLLYQFLMGKPQYFENVPPGSIQHLRRIGMYNNPIIDSKAFLSAIQEEEILQNIATAFKTWLDQDVKTDHSHHPTASFCP